jgi:hypothetical protein
VRWREQTEENKIKCEFHLSLPTPGSWKCMSLALVTEQGRPRNVCVYSICIMWDREERLQLGRINKG